jgi:hypothetical protein
MAPPFDESDFVDTEYQSAKLPRAVSTGTGTIAASSSFLQRPPTREELDAKVGETQQRLAELKRAQEELERQRAALEEARRRRIELQTGREEMLQHLTRGIGLLTEAEFAARRDAEQMAKTLSGLQQALGNIQAIHEETWTQDNWNSELTRALTAIESARMEWNGARLKWTLLSGEAVAPGPDQKKSGAPLLTGSQSFFQLCKVGLALTWPIAAVGLVLLGFVCFWLFR